MLSVQRQQKLIHLCGKPDRVRLFTETLDQPVVSSALDQGVPGTVGVRLKNNACIVLQLGGHSQIEGDVVFAPVQLQKLVNTDQPVYGLPASLVSGLFLRCLKHLDPAELLRHAAECFLQIPAQLQVLDILLYPEPVLDGHQVPELLYLRFRQLRLLGKSPEIIYMPQTDLKIRQAGIFHNSDNQGKNFRVRLRAVVIQVFHAHLGGFLQPSLKAGIIDEYAAVVAQAEGHILLLKIHGNRPCDRWRKIRPENKGVPLPVKKFVEACGRNGPHLSGKYIKKFKTGGLNRLIPV